MVETLMYYDGEKLQIDRYNHIVYVWYDDIIDYEAWFQIKLNKEDFHAYLDNKKSLYDILLLGDTYIFKRDVLECYDFDFEKVLNFDMYDLPDKDSFLN